jgi:selenocysteine lyase/cysteine desulfurase
MNFYRADGGVIDHRVIEHQANQANISLRTGCFCNPGGSEIALNLSAGELTTCFRQYSHYDRLTVDDFRLCIDGKSTGAVRVSLGLVSNFADVYSFMQFAGSLVDP